MKESGPTWKGVKSFCVVVVVMSVLSPAWFNNIGKGT